MESDTTESKLTNAVSAVLGLIPNMPDTIDCRHIDHAITHILLHKDGNLHDAYTGALRVVKAAAHLLIVAEKLIAANARQQNADDSESDRIPIMQLFRDAVGELDEASMCNYPLSEMAVRINKVLTLIEARLGPGYQKATVARDDAAELKEAFSQYLNIPRVMDAGRSRAASISVNDKEPTNAE